MTWEYIREVNLDVFGSGAGMTAADEYLFVLLVYEGNDPIIARLNLDGTDIHLFVHLGDLPGTPTAIASGNNRLFVLYKITGQTNYNIAVYGLETHARIFDFDDEGNTIYPEDFRFNSINDTTTYRALSYTEVSHDGAVSDRYLWSVNMADADSHEIVRKTVGLDDNPVIWNYLDISGDPTALHAEPLEGGDYLLYVLNSTAGTVEIIRDQYDNTTAGPLIIDLPADLVNPGGIVLQGNALYIAGAVRMAIFRQPVISSWVVSWDIEHGAIEQFDFFTSPMVTGQEAVYPPTPFVQSVQIQKIKGGTA